MAKRKTADNQPPMTAAAVKKALQSKANPEKAAFFPRFFRTGPGEYGEGDQFIGVVVPDQRIIAKEFKTIPLKEIAKLLASPLHECRLTALLILVHQFEKSKSIDQQKSIYDFYLKHVDYINNWDLVDSSCHKILGPYLFERNRKPLIQFAKANHLWKNRIAMVTTYHFIRRDDLDTTIEIAEMLIDHEHDLIHKAVGWMLRELGKQNEALLIAFLKQHYPALPRTALRYAIEKFPKPSRAKMLNGQF